MDNKRTVYILSANSIATLSWKNDFSTNRIVHSREKVKFLLMIRVMFEMNFLALESGPD